MASHTASEPALTEANYKKVVRLLSLIAVMAVIAFCFFASSICIAIVLASFLAILADPSVQYLERLGLPRYLAAGFVVLAGAAALSILIYGSYLKATEFSDNFDTYPERVRHLIAPVSSRVRHVRDSAGVLAHDGAPKGEPEVRVRETTPWTTYLVRGVGSMAGALVIAGVVPFLVFFMLIVREKLYVAFKAFAGHRLDVDALVASTKDLVVGYAIGNIWIGAAISALSVVLFWKIGLRPALALGIVSGMANLIPFVGVILAAAVPLVAGLVQFHASWQYVAVIVAVSGLHLVSSNFLLPRFVGSRLDVGPVAATIGLLFWGWLWGVVGILLAVPLTAVLKLLADSDPGLGQLSNLLARNPRRFPRKRLSTC
jgi:predicted PurR-regulated permease PerM